MAKLTGLTEEEAAQRLARDGPNQLAHRSGSHLGAIVLEQFRDYMVLVLIGVSFMIYAVMDLAPGDPVLMVASPDATEEEIAAQQAECEKMLAACTNLDVFDVEGDYYENVKNKDGKVYGKKGAKVEEIKAEDAGVTEEEKVEA